jgi:hypothetical protein
VLLQFTDLNTHAHALVHIHQKKKIALKIEAKVASVNRGRGLEELYDVLTAPIYGSIQSRRDP